MPFLGETFHIEAIIFMSHYNPKENHYLLQQRALEELNIFVRVVAEIPKDWPSVNPSDTPSILTANAKLLQIFAAWIISTCQSKKYSPKTILEAKIKHILHNRKSIATFD